MFKTSITKAFITFVFYFIIILIMTALKDILPPNLFEVLDRARICSPKQVIMQSVWDLKKVTNLSANDILRLKNIITNQMCPVIVTCDIVNERDERQTRVSTGCLCIDNLLRGGFRRGTITELYGESGSGKTQVALQSALHNWSDGCVYICTEDLFPNKRFEEIKRNLPTYNADTDYGKNIFVEHITEAKDLLFCIKMRLPRLLSQNKIALVIIDSIAAPFRCENTSYMKRAEELRELAIMLISIAQEYNISILCINQVSASFDDVNNVLPALGLAWSNMVSTRLMMRKTLTIMDIQNFTTANVKQFGHKNFVRELSVVFAPDLPCSSVELIITSRGIQGIQCK